MPLPFFAPSADPVDCEACGMVLAPPARVIHAGGDPSRNYMATVLRGPPIRRLKPGAHVFPPTLEERYLVCHACAEDLGTLEARIFARQCREDRR